jgi:hypothetical protein
LRVFRRPGAIWREKRTLEHKEITMSSTLRILGILAVVGALTLLAAPVQAGGGRFGGPGGRGGGNGRGAQPVTSVQDQFFGQTQAKQNAFFSQSVFAQPNFVVTPMFQPGLAGTTYVSPPTSNILPPLFVASYQPGFYLAPVTYSVGGAYTPQATIVYPTPQSVNSYSSGTSITPRMGLIGRW